MLKSFVGFLHNLLYFRQSETEFNWFESKSGPDFVVLIQKTSLYAPRPRDIKFFY